MFDHSNMDETLPGLNEHIRNAGAITCELIASGITSPRKSAYFRRNRMKTTSQKHAELRKISKQAKDNIYDMLKLACQITEDHEYVDEKFGSEAALIEEMEKKEFSHFGGVPTLGMMLMAWRANPGKKTWAEHKFNVQVMIDLATPEPEKATTPRMDWKKRCAELEEEVAVLQAEVDRLNGEATRKAAA